MILNPISLGKASQEILDAAVEPERWPMVLQNICSASGAFGANMMEPTGPQSVSRVLLTDSLEKSMDAYLREEWHLREFRMRFIPKLGKTGVIMDRDYATDDQFRSLDYYKFLRQFNMGHSAIITFPAGSSSIFLVLQRYLTASPFNDEERALLHGIRRNLIAAASIITGLAAQRIGGMSTAFEMANIGCIFFDRSGRAVLVNAKAETHLGNDLQMVNGELKSRFPHETTRFRAEIKRVLFSDSGAPADGTGAVLFSREGKRPLVVRLQRLTGHLADVFSSAHMLALIEDTEPAPEPASKTIRNIFGLTPVEVEIALKLAKGVSPRAIAEQRSISYGTVRTHLRSIYQKTDTNRQSELTALLCRIRF